MRDGRTRVAVLSHGYYPRLGGIERQRAVVTPRLAQRGLEAYVLTRAVPGVPHREMRGGVRIVRTPTVGGAVKGAPAGVGRVLDSLLYTVVGLGCLIRYRPDVIHSHEFLSTARLGLLAGRLLHVPVIVTAHLSGPDGDVQRALRSRRGRRLLSRIRRSSALSIAVSRQIDDELAAAGMPSQRRVVIPNGVDLHRFHPARPGERAALRRDLGIRGHPVVVFAGRLAAQKRLDVLLEAWTEISQAWPTSQLLLLGDGEEAERLRKLAPPNVDVRGAVIDVSVYLRAADVFVLPSDAEGMSNALLEAQATGVPAVVTNVGAAPDVIADSVTGLLVPAGDPGSLARAIGLLLADEALRERMGAAARERMVAEFSVERTVDSFMQAYETVVRRSPCLQA